MTNINLLDFVRAFLGFTRLCKLIYLYTGVNLTNINNIKNTITIIIKIISN